MGVLHPHSAQRIANFVCFFRLSKIRRPLFSVRQIPFTSSDTGPRMGKQAFLFFIGKETCFSTNAYGCKAGEVSSDYRS
jgi:hypothetical protein